jgi:hypothetical protein
LYHQQVNKMSEDQSQQPQSERPQTQVKPIAADRKAAKTPNSPVTKIEPQKVLRSFAEKVGSVWQSLVDFLRSRLPTSTNEKLSDTFLTAVIAAIVIVAIGTILTILPGKSPKIAAVSSPEPSEIIVSPSPESSEIIVSPSSESSEINLPETVATEEIKPTEIIPPVPLRLTPEQELIATIQKQVSEFTTQVGGGLIESIQVDFLGSILTVKIADDWYDVGTDEQDKLVDEMFQQTHDLEFKKLEITNSQGEIIARSPVIGSQMIILDRHKSEIIGNS